MLCILSVYPYSLATFAMKERYIVFKLFVNFKLIFYQHHSYCRVCCDQICLVPCTLCCVFSVCNICYERESYHIRINCQLQTNSLSIWEWPRRRDYKFWVDCRARWYMSGRHCRCRARRRVSGRPAVGIYFWATICIDISRMQSCILILCSIATFRLV